MRLVKQMIFLLLTATLLGGCAAPAMYEGPTPTKEVILRLDDKMCS